jgi:hypothetical protein
MFFYGILSENVQFILPTTLYVARESQSWFDDPDSLETDAACSFKIICRIC